MNVYKYEYVYKTILVTNIWIQFLHHLYTKSIRNSCENEIIRIVLFSPGFTGIMMFQDYYEIKSNYILHLFMTRTVIHTTYHYYHYVEHAGWSLNKEFRL